MSYKLSNDANNAYRCFLDRIISQPEMRSITTDCMITDAFYYYPFEVAIVKIPNTWGGWWKQSNISYFRTVGNILIRIIRLYPIPEYICKDNKPQRIDLPYKLWLFKIEDLETKETHSATWCERGIKSNK